MIDGERPAHDFAKRPVVVWEGILDTYDGRRILGRLTVVVNDRYVGRLVAWLLSLGRNIHLKEAVRLEADEIYEYRGQDPPAPDGTAESPLKPLVISKHVYCPDCELECRQLRRVGGRILAPYTCRLCGEQRCEHWMTETDFASLTGICNERTKHEELLP